MAEHGKIEYAQANGNDYAEHRRTWENVIKLTKVGTVASLATLVAMGIGTISGSMFWMSLGFLMIFATTAMGLFSKGEGNVTPLAGVFVFLLLVWALIAG